MKKIIEFINKVRANDFERAFKKLPFDHREAILNALWHRSEEETIHEDSKRENEKIKSICKGFAINLSK